MEDFGKVMFAMPNAELPNLSKVLPKMADAAIQQQWTGFDGEELLAQTVAFARIVETAVDRHMRRSLHNARLLDFGVGYGRNVRTMLYSTNPENIFGIDAWDGSLALSRAAGIPCHLLLSDPMPQRLPVEDASIDVAFAFSVFTHLSEQALLASLSAIKKALSPDGLCIFTIRPKEYWLLENQYFDKTKREDLLSDHETRGFAFSAHAWSEGGTYGDTSMDIRYMERFGWRILGYDTTMTDKYQVSLIARRQQSA
jgi:SAM-dependent methyltransferase